MISLTGITGAALANGINPCGIGMMITFLGYLMVFTPSPKASEVHSNNQKKNNKIATLGVVYILSVFVSYLLLGLFFYGAAFYLQRLWIAKFFKFFVGALVMGAGVIQLKDSFLPQLPIHLKMGIFGGKIIENLLSRISIPVAILIGLATTAFSTPCMLPLYVGTATVLATSGLPMWQVLSYFIYYNLIFIGPLIVVLVVMTKSGDVVGMKEWSHKNEKLIRLIMGGAMLLVGWLIVR